MVEESIEKRIERFNRRMSNEFAQAEKGAVINLTSMIGEAEGIHQAQDRRRRSR